MPTDSKSFFDLHSELCKTLSHPKRQEILDSLRHGEMTVNDIVIRTGISQPNLSQHLSILRNKGVVAARHEGVKVFYSISHPKIIRAFDLISEVMREILEDQNSAINTVSPQL